MTWEERSIRRAIKKIKSMTREEFLQFQKEVGILDEQGKLTARYSRA